MKRTHTTSYILKRFLMNRYLVYNFAVNHYFLYCYNALRIWLLYAIIIEILDK